MNWFSNSSIVTAYTYNVFADSLDGAANNTVIFGAHLDSVPEGPGINDNGSGSASLLEIALQWARLKLKAANRIRFAWWGAEEIGLLGSRHFVYGLTAEERRKVLCNLNFDMLGSPNFVRYVYAGSSAPPHLRNASTILQNILEKYFKDNGLSYALAPMGGGSDYFPFITYGDIPASALATGAGALKTMTERTVYGGFANAAYDPCYHQPCDTFDNPDPAVLEQMARAAASAIETVAKDGDLRQTLTTSS